jgi:hypothetical protein
MSIQTRGSEVKEDKQPGRVAETPDLMDQFDPGKDTSLTPGFSSPGKFNPPLTPSNILKLQRSIGNQAVQRLITREKTTSGHRCGPACNHIQRHMDHQHEHEAKNTQIQRHMGHDHEEEEGH